MMPTNEFEREYYEAEEFWHGAMVQDKANQTRIELTARFIRDEVKSLLDVGCGNGVFLKHVARVKPNLKLTGVERSSMALKYVEAEKIQASIEEIPLKEREIDCVTCLEVLEHLPETIYAKGLDELARLSGNYIIVSVPYMEILEDSYTKCPNCKSIFNYELHLRSFNDDVIKNLFQTRGFECIETITTGTGIHFKGHKTFRKIFYPEQNLLWRSPICPICGYKSKITGDLKNNNKIEQLYSPFRRRKIISYFTFLPKLFWPKEKKDYWIIALYRRIF